MKDLKIAIIDPVGGHADNYYNYGLSIGLSKANVEVYYITSAATQKIEHDGVNTLYYFSNIWAKKGKVLKLYKYVIGLLKTFFLAKRNNIHVLHFMIFHVDWLFYFSAFICKLLGFKIVATLHDVTSFTGDRLPASAEKKLLSRIDQIIIHNSYSYEVINSIHAADNYNVVAHGNYIPFIKRVEPQKIDDSEVRMLFFGQIKKVKGLDVLLKALVILKSKGIKVKLTIAGRVWKGIFDEYQQMIDEYNIADMLILNIRFIPNEEMWDYFNDANLLVLPYREIFQSGVLLMAMSHGRAVLTSDIPAFSDLINDGENGFLFESENATALAEKIAYVAGNTKMLSYIEENAYRHIKQAYDWDESGRKTKAVYLKLTV